MLNLKETANQKIFFTSDWHYGHLQKFIWESRGYKSIQEHNEDLINIVNSIVAPDDILFNLGDLMLNSTIEDFEYLISNIKCKNMYLLFGNHPNRHYKNIYIPMVKNILGKDYTEESEIYPLRYKNIIYIGNYCETIINNQFIIMSHYPAVSWNEMKKGSYMLHGHEHSGVKEHLPDGTNGKILDVSWDYFKKPLSFAEIREIMNKKQIGSVGHH